MVSLSPLWDGQSDGHWMFMTSTSVINSPG